MTDWYVVQVRPSFENIAAGSLQRAGYETFCPMASIRGRRVVAFSGYLFLNDPFAGTEDEMGLSRAAWSWGVIRLLGGPNPMSIPQAVIDTIVDEMNEEGLIPLNLAGVPLRVFSPGELVQVIAGVMEGVRGNVNWADKRSVAIVPNGVWRATILARLEEVVSVEA